MRLWRWVLFPGLLLLSTPVMPTDVVESDEFWVLPATTSEFEELLASDLPQTVICYDPDLGELDSIISLKAENLRDKYPESAVVVVPAREKYFVGDTGSLSVPVFPVLELTRLARSLLQPEDSLELGDAMGLFEFDIAANLTRIAAAAPESAMLSKEASFVAATADTSLLTRNVEQLRAFVSGVVFDPEQIDASGQKTIDQFERFRDDSAQKNMAVQFVSHDLRSPFNSVERELARMLGKHW